MLPIYEKLLLLALQELQGGWPRYSLGEITTSKTSAKIRGLRSLVQEEVFNGEAFAVLPSFSGCARLPLTATRLTR